MWFSTEGNKHAMKGPRGFYVVFHCCTTGRDMLELQATNLMYTDSELRVGFQSDADLVLGKLSNNIAHCQGAYCQV